MNEEIKTSRIRNMGSSTRGLLSRKIILVIVVNAIKVITPRMILFHKGKILFVFTNALININIDILKEAVSTMNA
jgi:hypothetical protein